MKRRIIISVLFFSLFVTTTFTVTGCYGRFFLVKKIYQWNGSLGDKFLNSLIMFILLVVPVYEAAGFVDYVFLNTIEFWTGSHPFALNNDEKEIQYVKNDGKDYEITVTKNRIDVKVLDGSERTVALVYDTASQSWYAESDNTGSLKLAEIMDENGSRIKLIYPDGSYSIVRDADLKNKSL